MLRELIATDAFRFLLVLVRLGSAIMLFPAIGGITVPPRMRLMMALFAAFVILPPLLPLLPETPKSPVALAVLVGQEIIVGLFFGVMMQLLLAALSLTGNFIGYSLGLTNALISDPVTEQQSQLISGFLSTAVIALMLITSAHDLMFEAVVDSYTLFPAGAALQIGDMAQHLVATMGQSFVVGTKLAAPLLVFSVVFNVGLGLMNRLVPQMQVFFVGMPVQILGGFAILSLAIAVILFGFMRYFNEGLGAFVANG